MRYVSLRSATRSCVLGIIVGTSALHCAPTPDGDDEDVGQTSSALTTPTGANWIVLPRPPARTSAIFADDWTAPFTGSGATFGRVTSPKSEGSYGLSVTLGAAGTALASTVDTTTSAFAGAGQTELSFAFNTGASVHAGIASIAIAVEDDDSATTTTWTSLKPYLTTGTVTANTWYQVTIPMSVLNPSNLPIRRLLVGNSTVAGATFVLDNVRFTWTDASPTETLVYGDAIASTFVIDGWDSKSASNAFRTTGANGLLATFTAAWSAITLTHDWDAAEYPAGTHTTVSFDISGGSAAAPAAMKSMLIGLDGDPHVALTSYIPGGALAANTWYRVTAKTSDLAAGSYRQVTFKDESSSKYAFNIDQVRFQVDHAAPALRVTTPPPTTPTPPVTPTPPTPPTTPTVEAPIYGPTTCVALVRADRTVTGSGASDEYRWSDKSCGARTAAMVRSDPKGGNAVEMSYPVNGVKRTVPMSPETNDAGDLNAGGFGYVVSHLADSDIANRHGDDDSPLGSALANTYAVPFQGAHHAIHQYTVNYPRWGVSGGVDVKYAMPVTVQWYFQTGSDAPIWSVTYDLSAAPANAVIADMRAPYGSMNFDGAARGNWGDTVGGVAWADSYKFTSLATTALTLNSAWSWTEKNTGPAYNGIWTKTTDAEMGVVATQAITKMDAGGYTNSGNVGRGSSSAAGTKCKKDDGLNNLVHTMPCASDWSFQSANWSFWDNNGNPTVTGTTTSKRLAWGSDWGTLGASSLTTINGNVVAGNPKVSYSTFVVLDTHSKAPTATTAARVASALGTTLTATTGTVRTSGAAGVGRTDTAAYSPAGYSPIFGTWELDGSATGAVDLTINAASATYLENPTFVIHGWTSTTAPSAVTFDGTTLTANQGYFASVRAGSSEVWITVNAKARGAGHRLVVTP